MKKTLKVLPIFIMVLLINACASYKKQVDNSVPQTTVPDKEISHSFYLIGDAGNTVNQSSALTLFEKELQKASENSTALFLGDNIYPNGLPKKGDEGRNNAEQQLNAQVKTVSEFKGKTVFIPGNHDWYSNGIKGLERQEEFIEEKLGKNTFLPENGCPIEKVDVSDDIVLILIDSEWYMSNWDKQPTINDDCEIKTRESFFAEYESLIKKAQGKTTIVAMHHPMFTNGPHGGQYSLKSHLLPIPVLGTVKNIIRKTGGLSTVDLQNKFYNEFRKRIITISQENDKTIFVSGHEHSMQYLVQDNLPQIVSGSGSKTTATRNVGKGQFSYGSSGFTRLDVFEDGSSYVRFYSAEDNNIAFQTNVLSANEKKEFTTYPSSFPENKAASVYTKEEIDKSGLYKSLWGERYRKYYGIDVNVPTVNLDTYLGGLTPIRKGGGHQSKSLRLKDKQGREYVMRAIRKNAVQYLQAVAFKDQYIKGQFDGTYTEKLLLDVFTGAHPYAPFAIATLSDAVGVYHTNPVLFYVPKQNALGHFNTEFGDELYMIEERTTDGHGDKKSFGNSNELISTTDFLKALNKDEDIVLDEASYIRARLFDMLIGDWDRHEDQWRWAKFEEGGKTVYRPVPRDRDQAFSVMSDGSLLGFATKAVPSLRLMRSYDEELKSTKWFNLEPYPLDMALINEADKSVWDAQVKQIVDNMSDETINEAFSHFPKEVMDETVNEIKQKLKGRLNNLQDISDRYYYHINKFAVIKGTNKDDYFEIERINNETKITAFRIKQGVKSDIFHQRTYSKKTTKEIWIYGLDDDDVFVVSGKGSDLIKVRIIGGQNNDTYDIRNGNKIKVYDYKKKENVFVTNKGGKKLTDDYETNVYNYKKLKNSENLIIPTIGSNPDDGFKIGFTNTFTAYGFERNPFTSQHIVSAAYYFATNGFDMGYYGEFANIIGSTNLVLDAKFTSPNYATNFFGYGNESVNPEADEDDGLDVDLDYNRVKLRTLKIAPALQWHGHLGSKVKLGLSYESIEIEKTEGRFINTVIGDNVDITSDFVGAELAYGFENRDNKAFPTLGMETNIQVGYKSNIDESNGFGYIIPSIAFDYRLTANGQFVLATKFAGHFNIGDDFEFYQAAALGASNGLRGYRNERFTGKSAFVQSTDLRLNLRKVKTGILPLNIGIYGGLDYGRVWIDGDNSDRWNNSIGGGLFFNGADMIIGNISAFNGDDGLRLAFKLGFGF
ncbi:MAG: phosphoesterase [Bacteroidetes bacterium]|nr:MAG: phosphoesterase [Bacteroidota bacterium]